MKVLKTNKTTSMSTTGTMSAYSRAGNSEWITCPLSTNGVMMVQVV
uniref:Uncharacterized protein n=1 Tax=Arcella intermedia TaxID=1963864 RepID=A0A6B2LXU8_9EUKA